MTAPAHDPLRSGRTPLPAARAAAIGTARRVHRGVVECGASGALRGEER
jgi:hypothetical protein